MPTLHNQIQAAEARIAKLRAELGSPQERRERMGEEWWEWVESADLLDELAGTFQAQASLISRLQDDLQGPYLELRLGVFGGTGILFSLSDILEVRQRIHRAFNPGGEYPKTWAAEEKRWRRKFAAEQTLRLKETHQWKGVEI